MTGTIVNAIAIIVAGFLGHLAKKAIPQKMEKPVMEMVGLAVILIAIMGFLSTTIAIEGTKIKTSGEILLLVSLSFGALIGEMLKIDDKINKFGDYIGKKANIDGFSKGFVTATILFCVGAMAIFGALQDGIYGDSSILFVKSVIDAIAAFILSATMGIGVCFAAISVFIYQGTISLLASSLSPYLSPDMMNNICMVGYAVMVTIGTNVLSITNIKTANVAMAMIVPIIYSFFS